MAATLNGFGVLCKYAGWFARGERHYRRALAILEAHLGPEHDEVATILHNLGGIEHARGRWELAEPWARRAMALRTASLGVTHPRVAADAVALAAIVEELGRTDEAETLYRRALPIFMRANARYDVAITANNLAALVAARGGRRRPHASMLVHSR